MKAVTTLSLFAIYWLVCGVVWGMPPEEVLKRAMELPQKMETCQLEYNRPTSPIIKDDTRNILVDGDMWCFILTKPGLNHPAVRKGFDGHIFHHKRAEGEDSATYGTTPNRGNANGEPHPLVTPYYWFSDNSQTLKWTDLKSIDKWIEVKARMKFEGSRTVQDDSLDEFRLDRTDQEFIIGFSNKYPGFPRSVKRFQEGKFFSELFVSEVWSSPEGISVGLAFDVTVPNIEPQRTINVDPKSIRVNEPIALSEFQLNARDAIQILNTNETQKKTVIQETPKPGVGFRPLWTLLVIVLLIGVAIFLRRRSNG